MYRCDLWKCFKQGSSYDASNSHKHETCNVDMNLDDILTEDISMTWKISVNILLLDSTMLSLGDNYLRLRSKICVTLGLMQKHNPFKRRGPSHQSATSVDVNYILSGWI